MIRLPAIGAAVFALALLALPTFAMPAKEGDKLTHLDTRSQLQDVSLAEVVTTAQAQGDGTDGLPTTWCGDETGADNTANAVTPAAKAQFKVVYAYAADRANRFAGWRDALQTNVAVVQRFLSAQDGGSQVVQLPGARASYADNFGAISSAVQRALGPGGGTRNVIVLADSLSGSTQEYGLGETVMGSSGERQGAANVHNRGGLTSIL